MPYHFTTFAGGLKILTNLEVKLSSPIELNDPFEFLPCDDPRKGDVRTEAFRLASHGHAYFFSLTKDYRNPRIWAQYAQNHSGLAIEFDLSEEPFSQFTYGNGRLIDVCYDRHERPSIENFANEDNETLKTISELVASKGKWWSGEEELRLLIWRDWIENNSLLVRLYTDDVRILRLMKISGKSIKSVTIGHTVNQTARIQIRSLVKEQLPHAGIYQAMPDSKSYDIIRKKIS